MTPGNSVAVKTLVAYLKANLTGVQIIEEWPDPKKALNMPCISVMTIGTPIVSPRFPKIHKKVDVVGNPVQKKVVYITGQYDSRIQLDCWAEYKGKRDELYESLVAALDKQFIDSDAPSGLSLELVDYHNCFARYDQTGYTYMDSSDNAQRGEWRVKVDLEVNYPKLTEKTESIIAEITLESAIDESLNPTSADTDEIVIL